MDPGTYTISLTAFSDKGYDSSIVKQDYVTVYPLPVTSFNYMPGFPTVAEPQVYFHNLSAGEILYDWNFGDGTHADVEHPMHAYINDTGRYVVWLTVRTNMAV